MGGLSLTSVIVMFTGTVDDRLDSGGPESSETT